jgi:outer membrane protease
VKSIAPFILFVIFFTVFLSLRPQEVRGEIRLFGRPSAFSLRPRLGTFYGTIQEILYAGADSGVRQSELRWELKPLLYAGLDLAFGPSETVRGWGLFADLAFKTGLTSAATGTMEDRDWIDDANPETLTLFSSHENITEEALLFTLNAGAVFFLTDTFFLKGFFSLDYWHIKMISRNGYLQYGPNGTYPPPPAPVPWDPSWPREPFTGPGISYFQRWLILSPGLGLGAALGRFTLSGTVKISPLIFCRAEDNHLKRKILFTDYPSGGLYVEPGLDLFFSLSPKARIGLGLNCRSVKGSRGDNITEDYGAGAPSSKSKNVAGTEILVFEGNLNLTVSF